jgi:hypothetical protein
MFAWIRSARDNELDGPGEIVRAIIAIRVLKTGIHEREGS